MLNAIEKLLVLQDRDRRLRQLNRELLEGPARKKLIEDRLARHKAALAAAQEDLKKRQSAIKQLEIDVDAAQQRIRKFREQQTIIKTNQEYRALEMEIAAVQKSIRASEDAEIEIMEQVETSKASVAEKEKELAAEDSVVRQEVGLIDVRLKAVSAEMEQVKEERKARATEVPPDWLARYERVLAHTGDNALVPVETGSCGGCHMNLPPQAIHDARRGDTMVTCTFCGRLLYSA